MCVFVFSRNETLSHTSTLVYSLRLTSIDARFTHSYIVYIDKGFPFRHSFFHCTSVQYGVAAVAAAAVVSAAFVFVVMQFAAKFLIQFCSVKNYV